MGLQSIGVVNEININKRWSHLAMQSCIDLIWLSDVFFSHAVPHASPSQTLQIEQKEDNLYSLPWITSNLASINWLEKTSCQKMLPSWHPLLGALLPANTFVEIAPKQNPQLLCWPWPLSCHCPSKRLFSAYQKRLLHTASCCFTSKMNTLLIVV